MQWVKSMAKAIRQRVSIGMPAYNGEKWIGEAIESIAAQTFTDFELIVSDNASTDATEQICREYVKRDSRVRYFRNAKNIGANPNFNRVFQLSSSEYFKWASANDIVEPEMLAKCVEVLDGEPEIVMCYPRTKIFSDASSAAEKYQDNCHLVSSRPSIRFIGLLENMKLNNVMNGMIRSEVLKKTKLIENYFSSDVNLIAEIALYGKIFEIPEYLFLRRLEKESSTALKSAEGVHEHYYPERKKSMRFQQWIMTFKNFAAIARVDVDVREKVALYTYLIRRAIWFRHQLLQDIIWLKR